MHAGSTFAPCGSARMRSSIRRRSRTTVGAAAVSPVGSAPARWRWRAHRDHRHRRVHVLSGGGGLGDLGSLAGRDCRSRQGSRPESWRRSADGADANEREDCRIVADVNGIQAYWNRALRGYEPTRTRFFDAPMETGCGVGSPRPGRSTARATGSSTSTSAFSTSSSRSSAHGEAARGGVHPGPRVRPPCPEPHRRPAERRP